MTRLTKFVSPEKLASYESLGWCKSIDQSGSNEFNVHVEVDSSRLRNENFFGGGCVRSLYEIIPPYLIQRASINTPLNEYVGVSFSKSVDLDYMGSAEFEFGSPAESLIRMYFQSPDLEIHKIQEVSIAAGSDLIQLRLLTPLKGYQLANYVSKLKDLAKGLIRTKERTAFSSCELNLNRCDFWWDIDNDSMFSFNKKYMSRLLGHLETSWYENMSLPRPSK